MRLRPRQIPGALHVRLKPETGDAPWLVRNFPSAKDPPRILSPQGEGTAARLLPGIVEMTGTSRRVRDPCAPGSPSRAADPLGRSPAESHVGDIGVFKALARSSVRMALADSRLVLLGRDGLGRPPD